MNPGGPLRQVQVGYSLKMTVTAVGVYPTGCCESALLNLLQSCTRRSHSAASGILCSYFHSIVLHLDDRPESDHVHFTADEVVETWVKFPSSLHRSALCGSKSTFALAILRPRISYGRQPLATIQAFCSLE